MYTKTSLQHRLGKLDGLWVLHTKMRDTTEICYFFGMDGLIYQARLAFCKFGTYLVQVEKLPEDVEALELPVPAGTEVKAVLLEECEGSAYLALVLSQGVLRYKMAGEAARSAVSMTYTKESMVEEVATEVEICGYEHEEIPLPKGVFYRNMALAASACLVVLLGEAMVRADSPVPGGVLLGLGFAALLCLPLYPLYRCPHCRKASMRVLGYHPNVMACPKCGGICRCKNPLGRKRRW